MLAPKRIVVVDDDETNAKMLEEFLTGHGYAVTLAFSALDGLDAIIDVNPDVIILDLYLPDMKGSKLCVQLRSQKSTQSIPIILCTAHTISSEEKLDGFQAGVDDYLVRPFELAELKVRIEALLRRTTPRFDSEILAGIDALLKIPHEVTRVPIAPASHVATIVEPAAPAEPAVARSSVRMTEAPPIPISIEPQPFHPLRRSLAVLNSPIAAFQHTSQNEDLLTSLVLVLGTPMMAGFARTAELGSSVWLGSVGLRLLTHVSAWLALGFLLHLAVPFLGRRWSSKRALSIAGLTWAPRILEAAIAVVYARVAPMFVEAPSGFSGGLEILPGLRGHQWSPLLSGIDTFSLWSVALVLVAVWTVCGVTKKWNSTTVTIVLIALLCAAVVSV